ncbi:MAG: ABC transporter permease subunit, partial [Thermoplasmata archaeon]|nr:ABC transporter permease subunit [Thermoplasmata archaeon]
MAAGKGNQAPKKGQATKKDDFSFDSSFKSLMRGPMRTWKLYRSSKTGLAGLAIVLGFLIMAVFAPIISPYDADFRAPAEDVFYANNVEMTIDEQYNWSAPVGLLADTREEQLIGMMLYSSDAGKALVYPITTGTQEILVDFPTTFTIPQGLSYIEHVHFPRVPGETSYFLILDEQIVYEYSYNLIDLNVEWDLGFEPKFISNLWNGYTLALKESRLAIVMADEHNVWLYDKVPRDTKGIYPYVRTFTDSMTIDDVSIIGNPLVVDGDFDNGSMIIIPTSEDLRAYRIDVEMTTLTNVVENIQLGPMMWRKAYTLDSEEYTPVDSLRMITFPYAQGASEAFGKTVVIMATTDDDLIAYTRETGEILWAGQLIMPGITDFEISDLYPSPAGVIVTGKAETRGFIAGVDASTGAVRYNRTMYSLTEGYINSPPQYVSGLGTFVYSSDKDVIYLSDGLLGINATFGAPSGGALTPVSFLGNIYIQSSVTGNYFAVVTQANTLYISTLSGVNKAPLPPGVYPSGNRYILGTDYEGHDILAWIIYGTRSELMVGITAAFFAVVIGTVVGLVAGFYPGLVDSILMRATDVMLSLPGLVILLLFAAVFGPSLVNIMIIIAILSWAGIARVIRSVTLSLKERAFVDAAIIAGASESRLIFKHIAPNVLPYTFLYMTFTISGAIVTEAILAFLGFGDVNHVTWGMMLQFLQISGHSLTA